MGDFGRDEVEDEEKVVEDALGEEGESSGDPAWFGEFHEREEMHAFVFGVFEHGVDPTLVAFHESERLEVSTGGSDHSGYAGDGFEEDDSVQPGIGSETEPFGSHLGQRHGAFARIRPRQFIQIGAGLVDHHRIVVLAILGVMGVGDVGGGGARGALLRIELLDLLGNVRREFDGFLHVMFHGWELDASMVGISGCEVEDGSGHRAHGSSHLVSERLTLSMDDFDRVQILVRVDRVEQEIGAIGMLVSWCGKVFCLHGFTCGCRGGRVTVDRRGRKVARGRGGGGGGKGETGGSGMGSSDGR